MLKTDPNSVLLVSPENEVLLIHRVQTSSSFPSAHVFPGGNVDQQDGAVPDTGIARHKDSLPYRCAALREVFEESGILLAKVHDSEEPLNISSKDMTRGRQLVHQKEVRFKTWLHHRRKSIQKGRTSATVVPDVGKTLYPDPAGCSNMAQKG